MVRGPLSFLSLVALSAALALVPASPILASSQAVTVTVLGEVDPPIEAERYVALVPSARPLNEPIVEAVLGAGEISPRWHVPVGEYSLLCSAARHSFLVQRVSLLPDNAGHDTALTCTLEPLVFMTGQVVNPAGQPIPDARVSLLGLRSEELEPTWSSLGMEHLARLVTLTDAEGRFRYGGPKDSRAALWIEAPLASPSYRDDLSPFVPDGSWQPIVLESGGSASVTLDPSGGLDQLSSYRLSLRPTRPLENLPWGAYRLWLRPATTETISWSALPPGDYELLLKPIPGSALGPPLRLSSLEIRPGTETRAEVQLPSSNRARGALILPLAEGMPFSTPTIAVWKRGSPRTAEVTARGPSGPVVSSDGCELGSRVIVETDTMIAPPLEIDDPTACTDSRPLELRPATTLTGRFAPPRGYPLPSHGEVTLQPCPETSPDEAVKDRLVYPFAVDPPSGSWSARLPAGCHDLTLTVGDFLPLRLSDTRSPSGEKNSLGDLTLEAGSAVVVRIIDPTGGPAAGVSANLLTVEQLGGAVAASAADDSFTAVASAQADTDGWLEIRGVPGGSYHLLYESPGTTPTVSPPFELITGREHVLDDLRQPSPARLGLQVEDGDFSPGSTFELIAFQHLACGWTPILSRPLEIDASGQAEITGLAPGAWRFEVVVGEGGSSPVRAGATEMALAEGESGWWQIEARTEVYRGRLTADGEPVQADLRFEPVDRETPGATTRKPITDTDDEGFFRVRLEKPGTYLVRAADGDGLDATLPDVVFDDPDETVELELPTGRVRGLVVDPGGEPVADALVTARRIHGLDATDSRLRWLSKTSRSRADGTFEIDQLSSGEWNLQATIEDRSSREQEVSLTGRLDGVQLVVEGRRIVAGQVLVDGQPIPGATGSIARLGPGASVTDRGASFATDDTGTFEARIGGESRELNVSLEAPGLPLATYRVAPSDGLVLELPREGGGLSVEPAAESWTGFDPGRILLVAADGSFVNPTGTRSAITAVNPETGGTRLEVPRLAPGLWSVVYVDTPAEIQTLLAGLGASLAADAQVQVTPESVARVMLEGGAEP